MSKFNLTKLSKSLIAGSLSVVIASMPISQAFANNNLPDLGTAAVNTFSLEKEAEYGDAYMRVIRSSAPVLNDPVLEQYLTELGNRLVAHAHDVKTPFYFFLLRNDEINAFAFFGGHVGVHTGLFLNADNESQLASVLSHEITHVTQRHLARSAEAQAKTGPAAIAGLLGAILLTIAAPQAGMAAIATTQALATQTRINYTRLHEKEADRIGMQVLVDSGFDPYASGDFFAKLANRYRYTSKPPQMLLTHPLPESRISEARIRAQQYPHRHIPDDLSYQLAKARIQVRYSSLSAGAALQLFEDQLKNRSYTFKDAALYGKALALMRSEDNKQAEQIIDQLLKKDPHNLFYLDTQSDLLLARKDYKKAIAVLSKERDLKPTSEVININLANAYIEAKQAKKAIPILEEALFLNKQSSVPYLLMADAYKQLGNRSMQYFVSAENYALAANYNKAIDQLNYAYQYAQNDPLQRARIEARISQFKQAEKQLDTLKN